MIGRASQVENGIEKQLQRRVIQNRKNTTAQRAEVKDAHFSLTRPDQTLFIFWITSTLDKHVDRQQKDHRPPTTLPIGKTQQIRTERNRDNLAREMTASS